VPVRATGQVGACGMRQPCLALVGWLAALALAGWLAKDVVNGMAVSVQRTVAAPAGDPAIEQSRQAATGEADRRPATRESPGSPTCRLPDGTAGRATGPSGAARDDRGQASGRLHAGPCRYAPRNRGAGGSRCRTFPRTELPARDVPGRKIRWRDIATTRAARRMRITLP